MAHRLSSFATQLVAHRDLLRANLTTPVLVWEAGANESTQEPWTTTGALQLATRPHKGEPVVFELKKGSSKQNAFAMGITVGRTENNDIPLDDPSVSRFHAYFQQDAKTKVWRLVDAESSNGTSVGPLRLKPSQPMPVQDKARLKFGSVEVQFLEPDSFLTYLDEMAQR